MPVLDAHTHLFPPEIIAGRDRIAAREPGFAAIYGDRKSRMVDAAGLAAYMEAEGIDRVIAACFPFSDGGLIRLANDYVIEAARSDRRIVPFIVTDRQNEADAVAEAQRCADRGARGVGEMAWYERPFDEAEEKRMESLADYLERAGMVFMMHLNEQVGHAYPGKGRADFAEVVRLVRHHPDLKVLLAHMGGGLCFCELMPEIRKSFARVYYDLAAVPFLYSDALYSYAAHFLADKVIFGSDYPLLGLRRYRAAIEALGLEAAGKILWENGVRLLGD
jgi:hypothetical protein